MNCTYNLAPQSTFLDFNIPIGLSFDLNPGLHIYPPGFSDMGFEPTRHAMVLGRRCTDHVSHKQRPIRPHDPLAPRPPNPPDARRVGRARGRAVTPGDGPDS